MSGRDGTSVWMVVKRKVRWIFNTKQHTVHKAIFISERIRACDAVLTMLYIRTLYVSQMTVKQQPWIAWVNGDVVMYLYDRHESDSVRMNVFRSSRSHAMCALGMTLMITIFGTKFLLCVSVIRDSWFHSQHWRTRKMIYREYQISLWDHKLQRLVNGAAEFMLSFRQ